MSDLHRTTARLSAEVAFLARYILLSGKGHATKQEHERFLEIAGRHLRAGEEPPARGDEPFVEPREHDDLSRPARPA